MNHRIYLDNNATTFVDSRVLATVNEAYSEQIGNPSSVHAFGQEARQLLTKARRSIALLLGVKPSELIFTSGGTEAANIVIRGMFEENPRGHVVTTDLEHACVYNTFQLFEKRGLSVNIISPGIKGAVSSDEILAALRPDTRLISIMAVNNETGVKSDIDAIAAIAEERGTPLFVDGVAWLGKESFVIPKGVTAMCFSAHKFHGPKGVGLAFIRKPMALSPLFAGGGQEGGLRSGTENIPGIAGMAEAIRLSLEELPDVAPRMARLRDRLEQGLMDAVGGIVVNGEGKRICNTSNLTFEDVEGESLLMLLDLEGVAVSHGSACAAGALEPSRVLLNMGLSRKNAHSAIRFSLSRFTTEEEIDRTIDIVAKLVNRLRK